MNRDAKFHLPNRSPRAVAMAAARRALRESRSKPRAGLDSDAAIDATVEGVLRTLMQFDRWLEMCKSDECADRVAESYAASEVGGLGTSEFNPVVPSEKSGPASALREPPPTLLFVTGGPRPATIGGPPL